MNRSNAACALLTSLLVLCGIAAGQGSNDGTRGTQPVPPAGGAGDPTGKPLDDRFRSQVTRSQLRERAIEMLSKAVLDPSPLIRANALEGLQSAPKRAEAAVRAGLSDENAGVRFVAAMTVGQLKLKTSSAFVEPLLADPSPQVQAAAIYAMAQCGRNPDPSPLGSMLMDSDARVRSEAARIVGLLGNPSAIPMLKSAAAEADRRNRMMGGASDQQFQLERVFQLQVAEALSRLGEPNASDPIRAALYPQGREGLESAAFAAQLLGDLKVEKAVAELVDLVEQATPETAKNKDARQRQFVQPKEVRLAAATALAKMGYRDGLYVAEQFRADEDPAVRAQAAFLMSQGARIADIPALEAMLDDPSPVAAVAAAAATLKALDRLD